MIRRFSDIQIDNAKRVSLLNYLSRRGAKLKQAGREYKWIYSDGTGEHDSVTIKSDGSKWFDHKRQQGGDTIGFLQEFMGLSFKEAVEELLNGEKPVERLQYIGESVWHNNQNPELPQKKEFKAPERNKDMRRLYAYLTKQRFIKPEIITHFVREQLLYEEPVHHNIVFLAADENGVPRGGQLKGTCSFDEGFRGTLAGSDTRYGFGHKGRSCKLFVYEAPIDLLSYLCLFPNWEEHNYIALDGLSPKAMLFFLENNLQVNEINICVDHDEAGIEATDRLRDILIDKGYAPENIHRQLPSMKDWNECLKEKNGVKALPAQGHPSVEAYLQSVQYLCETITQTKRNRYLSFSEMFKQKGCVWLVNVLEHEHKILEQEIRSGLTPQVISERLRRIALYCLAGSTELMTNSHTSPNIQEKTDKLNHLALEMSKEYKPYKDRGRLTGRRAELKQSLDQLELSVKQNFSSEQVAGILKTHADICIRAGVYMQTGYEREFTLQLSQTEAASPVMGFY